MTTIFFFDSETGQELHSISCGDGIPIIPIGQKITIDIEVVPYYKEKWNAISKTIKGVVVSFDIDFKQQFSHNAYQYIYITIYLKIEK